MDGENNGSKPYEQMDDLFFFPPIFGNTHIKPNPKLANQKKTTPLFDPKKRLMELADFCDALIDNKDGPWKIVSQASKYGILCLDMYVKSLKIRGI